MKNAELDELMVETKICGRNKKISDMQTYNPNGRKQRETKELLNEGKGE